MSVEENKAIARLYIVAGDKLDLEAIAEAVSPEVMQQIKDRVAWIRKVFPGHRIKITDMVAEGDKVWLRLATSGGYAGGWKGIPATDKQWQNTGVAFLQLSGGKTVKDESLFNVLGHLRQLGAKVVPSGY